MNERIKDFIKQLDLRDNDIDLERFAELVRQDEREACAKLCEKVHDDYINDRNNDGYDWPDGRNCAEAIRARNCCDAVEEAKRNERYIKEMEQPTPKQSGTFAITVSKVCDADVLPPTANAVYWIDMVVANLVRNGVNKHKARELAYHFYTYTTPLENSNG